jgi:hypothetical protein
MCLTLRPSELSNTILLAHSLEVDGVTINVLGYQNKAKNRSRGPNAMILPIPSLERMGPENCIDTTKAPKFLDEYSRLFLPVGTRGMRSLSKGVYRSEVQVFESGSYTVVLAANASDIPSALDRVPENKRPAPHPEIFDAYQMWYPGWSVALCCWDGEIEAEPLLWWYRPLPEFRDRHFLPGLDGHDGKVPDPSRKSVPIDHTVVLGCERHNGVQANASRIVREVPADIARWLPEHVCGERFEKQQAANGDWVIEKAGLNFESAKNRLHQPRAKPPGFVSAGA